jgi:deazaflavin-dependent oxidoreductase (nitroreductase family)
MWYNPIMEWVLKSPLHGMLSGNTMIVYFIGRKSGKAYHVPVGYLHKNDSLLTVSSKQRTWWRNLRGGADVTILLKGKLVSAHAQVAEDNQGVAEGLKDFIGENQQAARIFGVKLGVNGQLEPESLQQATRERVIVRTSLR